MSPAAPPPPELLAALEAYSVLGAPLHGGIARLSSGHLHATFALRTSAGEYIVQRISPVFSPAIHDNILVATERLRARGVTTFTLVPTDRGDAFVDLGSRGRWRVMSRLPGRTASQCAGAAQARSAGALLARFHDALSDLATPLQPLGFVFHDTAAHLADLDRAIASHAAHADLRAVVALRDEIAAIARDWPSLGGLPDRVIHGDPKITNVLFDERDPDRATALIDLDTLCRLPLYFDLGDAWRSWCNVRGEDQSEARLDLDLFRAAADGYLSALAAPLDRTELESLAHALERVSLELCSRFAADVLHERHFDWDRSRYESAAAHNLDRTRTQLSLARQARETHTEQRRFLLG